MQLNDWFLYFYFPILNEFRYDPSKDVESARILEEIAKLEKLDVLNFIKNKKVVIIGNAKKNFKIEEEKYSDYIVITAGKAVLNYDGKIDVHVTDLDEGFKALCYAVNKAKVVIVHAHGDNIDLIKECVPSLDKVVGTTQNLPFKRIYNFGGFTDGDRAAIIAKNFAQKVKLLNFRFDIAENNLKLKKLKWAKKILKFEGLV